MGRLSEGKRVVSVFSLTAFFLGVKLFVLHVLACAGAFVLIVLPPFALLAVLGYFIEMKKRLPPIAGNDYPAFEVSEEEYRTAWKIAHLWPSHPAVKELAEMQDIPPRVIIERAEEVVRNYNLAKRAGK